MKKIFSKWFILKHEVEGEDGVDLDEGRYVRFGYLVIAGGLGVFLAWAVFAPLDQGVPGQGVVTVINQRVVVQHPIGGLIEDVLIKEGDKVKAGQILLRLNTMESTAQAEMVRAQYRAAQTEVERLEAELSGKKVLLPDVASTDGRMSDALNYQAAVLQSRQAVLASELAVMRENLRGLEGQAGSLRTLVQTRIRQSELAKQQLGGVKELSEAGYYPRNRMLELEGVIAGDDAKTDETRAELGRIESGMAEIKHKLLLRQQDYKKEMEIRLAELQQQLIGLKSKLNAAEFIEKNSVIVSPVDGVSVGLNFHGKGQVIPPGGRIVDVVPDNESLIIEAKFAPDMINELRVGLKVDIRFSGLHHVELPAIDGEVLTVSADYLVDEATHAHYFLARVGLTKQGLAVLAAHGVSLQPGMPSEVLVKTGERTLLNYLIEPVKERMEWSFIEK